VNTPDDCRRCGVCCFSKLENYVRVSGADWTRLGDDAERVAHFVGNRAFLRMREGHCAALELRHSEEGAVEFFCSIYERRPQICRDLARGSPECEGERAVKTQTRALLRLHDVG
jgi:Fe-S-cluster containining protein